MRGGRWGAAALAGVAAMAGVGVAATPAAAQFYLQPHDFRGQPVTGDAPGMVVPLPGATPDEYRAALAWTMRSALNVAALQCGFEPTLHMAENWRAVLRDHDGELDRYQAALQRYYARSGGPGAARAGKGTRPGQAGFDRFGTLTYSAFSTTAAQLGFCQTAASVAREAVFTPRGQFAALAERRMRELRNSLVPYGEERFGYYAAGGLQPGRLPRLDAACWKKGEWQAKKCGALAWPPAPPPAAVTAAP